MSASHICFFQFYLILFDTVSAMSRINTLDLFITLQSRAYFNVLLRKLETLVFICLENDTFYPEGIFCFVFTLLCWHSQHG